MVLIRHIENYLTKVGIDKGIDDRIVYNITVRDGQVNIANDNASITPTNVANAVDIQELAKLICSIREKAEKENLSEDDREVVDNSLEVIEEEVRAEKPRKGFIKTALNSLSAIKSTTEFAAAVVTLIQFVQPLIV